MDSCKFMVVLIRIDDTAGREPSSSIGDFDCSAPQIQIFLGAELGWIGQTWMVKEEKERKLVAEILAEVMGPGEAEPTRRKNSDQDIRYYLMIHKMSRGRW